jgi:hypothetical protein
MKVSERQPNEQPHNALAGDLADALGVDHCRCTGVTIHFCESIADLAMFNGREVEMLAEGIAEDGTCVVCGRDRIVWRERARTL